MSLSKFVPPPILDHYDDGGALFLRELGGLPCPDMVKTAADVTGTLRHAEDYALVVDTTQGQVYKFPILDAGNTLLSSIYFEKVAQALPDEIRIPTAQRLAEALVDIGLVPPAYITDALEKTASATDDALLYETFGSRPQSIADLVQEFKDMAPVARREAGIMLKQAGVILPEDLVCYSASTSGSDIEACIRLRVQMAGEDLRPFAEDLVKAAQVAIPEELAEALYDIDMQFNLTRFYDSQLPDPFQSVYGCTLEKAASMQQQVVTIAGHDYPADAVSLVASSRGDEIDATFGNGVAMQLTMSPVEVLDSLPEPHKLAIARIIDDSRTN